ncbi:MAG: MBL fold metallo-hydrolase [Acidobacteria bacterium]|nr:MBL fold metallo-hydrolase [Acidobacteriota bacterium]MCZ6726091.1 MBL fold metallo-hydrolase [Acidobacteriota bacterium]
MEATSLYDQVLANVAGVESSPPSPPRDSASVVLWRGSGRELEVFWIERARGMAFMGGWHAFPGGGVSSRDGRFHLRSEPTVAAGVSPAAALPPAVIEGVGKLGPILAPGVAVAALRELFEETGVLPGLAVGAVSEQRRSELRLALSSKELRFAEVLRELAVDLDVSRLVYAGRWLTPPLGPVRFDNRFFLLEWTAQEAIQPVADSREAAGGEWIRPTRAVARWRQGRALVAPPILHLMRVLEEDGPVDGLDRLHHPDEVNIGPFRVVEFRPGVILLPVRTPTLPPAEFTNCYLLGNQSCVIVDPGSPHGREIGWLAAGVEAAREKLGREVREIWLTHHHPDHVGGAAALRERLGVPIAAHAETAVRLAGRLRVDREIADGDVVDLGSPGRPFTVRAIHTPGHARGHLCFLHEELGSLLVGDVLAGFGTIVIDPPEGNMQQYLSTLEQLRDIAPRTLFPGHGPTMLDALGKLREYREHRRWREERIFRAWCRGLRDPAAMLPEVYDDLPQQAVPLAIRQIVAHLERLEVLGRLGTGSPGARS